MGERTQRGEIAELLVATEITKRNFTVCIPFSHNSPYDLIIDTGIKLLKCQIKRVYKVNNHGTICNCIDGRRSSGIGKNRKNYKENSFDILIACDVGENNYWILPFVEFKKYKAQVYLDTKQNMKFKNNWSLVNYQDNKSYLT